MVNMVAATFGAIAKDAILNRAWQLGQTGELDSAQVALIAEVCEGESQPPTELLPWLESLMPGITHFITDTINARAKQLQTELPAHQSSES